ncbi:MAG TPA: hypothetical protein VLE93_00530 [Candidatus Saccharimonadales bacterium]|nr:hypothetical protein [Candidatus Saccharimonadales bacterium]
MSHNPELTGMENFSFSEGVISASEIKLLKDTAVHLLPTLQECIRRREQIGDLKIHERYPEIKTRLTDAYISQHGSQPVGEAASAIYVATQNEIYVPLDNALFPLVEEMEVYLDSLNIWKHKLTTVNQEARIEKFPQPEKFDSLYYITPEGVSLRLKRRLVRDEDVHGLVQPYMEKIFFKNYQSEEVKEVPELGLSVIEYTTAGFAKLMTGSAELEKYEFAAISPLADQENYQQQVTLDNGKIVTPPGPLIEHGGDNINYLSSL